MKLPLPVITSSGHGGRPGEHGFQLHDSGDQRRDQFQRERVFLPDSRLNSLTGAITGTPTNAGIFNVTITANNSTGATTNSLTIIIYNGVAPAPVITSALTATGSLSASFNYQIIATNYPTSFFAIGLPLGLSFDPAEHVFGIPSVTGNFAVTLRAINSGGTGSANLNLTINPEPPPRIDSVSCRTDFPCRF